MLRNFHTQFLKLAVFSSSLILTQTQFLNAAPIELKMPIDCELNENCILQQLPDMDLTKAIKDPFCGSGTYDGHKGTDIRVRTLVDTNDNIPIVASADGIVRGTRNNMPDRLIRSAKDLKLIKNNECGNGVVLDHGQNIETQYCHLKFKSVQVKKGQQVKQGDVLGYLGYSGKTQFPHIHLSVRQNGQVIDPFTGSKPGEQCKASNADSWWAKSSPLNTPNYDALLLDAGVSGTAIEHNKLVEAPVPTANTNQEATVGWVWFANLKSNDQVYIKLEGPNGFLVENLSKPLKNNMATRSGFVGKKRKPIKGEYTLSTYIKRGDKKMSVSSKTIKISQ